MKVERTLSAVLCLARREASSESFRVGKEMSIFFWGKSSGSGVEGEFIHLLPSCEDGQGEMGGRKTSQKCFKEGPELRQGTKGMGKRDVV